MTEEEQLWNHIVVHKFNVELNLKDEAYDMIINLNKFKDKDITYKGNPPVGFKIYPIYEIEHQYTSGSPYSSNLKSFKLVGTRPNTNKWSWDIENESE